MSKELPSKPHEDEACACRACAAWSEDFAYQVNGYKGFTGVYRKLKYMPNPFSKPSKSDAQKATDAP